jgi:glycosyltransferase involved in cell wall biosynthesis
MYPWIPDEKLEFVPNGIELERFARTDIKRIRHKVAWISSPDRGLDVLCNLWPNVLKGQGLEDAQLHVFYGFNNLEKIGERNDSYKNYAQAMREFINKVGAIDRGRLNQTELAEELMSSSLVAYPSSFLETFCIGAAESMAAGCVFLASNCGAIPETTGGAALLVDGYARNENYMYRFLGNMLALLKVDDLWKKYHDLGLKRAKALTWDKSYRKWRKLWKETR